LAQSQRQGASVPLAGYVLHNLTWLWQPSAAIELSIGIHNLTDVQYDDQLLPDMEKTRQSGRSVRLQLQWRFSQ
jgi:outer membrane receptor protein involved in Fe transport